MVLCRRFCSGLVLAFGGIAVAIGCSAGEAATPDGSTSSSGTTSSSGEPGGDSGGDGSKVLFDSAPFDAPHTDASDDEDAGPIPGACTPYCTQVMDVCKGINQQYPTIGTCFNACRYFPPGDPDDLTENSLNCRTIHTIVGSTTPQDADGHCLHCGIYGYGGCGNPCDPFCTIAMDWCGRTAAGAPFADMADCQAKCATWEDAPGPTMVGVLYSSNGPTTGNTRDCRQYHLTTALRSKADREIHCPLAGHFSTACK